LVSQASFFCFHPGALKNSFPGMVYVLLFFCSRSSYLTRLRTFFLLFFRFLFFHIRLPFRNKSHLFPPHSRLHPLFLLLFLQHCPVKKISLSPPFYWSLQLVARTSPLLGSEVFSSAPLSFSLVILPSCPNRTGQTFPPRPAISPHFLVLRIHAALQYT